MEADLGGNRPQHEGSQTDELRDQYNRTVAIDLGVPQVKLIAPIVPEEAERGAILFPTTADSRDLMFITGDNFDPRGRVERSFGASSHISLEQLVAVCGEATGLSFRRNGSLIDFRRQGVERVEESEAIQQLLDHYVRQSVPETVRLAPELSKANGEVHYDGNGHALILHDAEDLRSVFLAYGTDSGIVGSMGPIEDLGRDRLSEGALREIRQRMGSVPAERTAQKVASVVEDLVQAFKEWEAKAPGQGDRFMHRPRLSECLGTPFFNSSIHIEKQDGKVMVFLATGGGPRKFYECAEQLGFERNSSAVQAEVMLEAINGEWVGIDFEKALTGLDIPADEVAAVLAREVPHKNFEVAVNGASYLLRFELRQYMSADNFIAHVEPNRTVFRLQPDNGTPRLRIHFYLQDGQGAMDSERVRSLREACSTLAEQLAENLR